MKNLLKILRVALIVFVIVFAVTFAFLFLRGKEIVTGQIEKVTHKKVTIGYVGLTLPFNLEIRNLDIPGLTKIDYASVSPSIRGLLSGSIILNNVKLVKPQFSYTRVPASPDNKTGEPSVSASAAPTAPNPPATLPEPKPKPATDNGGKYLRLIIKNMDIKGARIDFTDHALSGEGIKIIIKDINLHLTNLYIYPRPAVANFELTGRIPWLKGQEEGKFEAKGWVNLFKKDMEAKVRITDIDGVYLYPYYSEWVNLEKARIESAKLKLTSNIKSVDNLLTAECHLELDDMVLKEKPEEEMSKSEKIASTIMGIFKALNQGKVVVNFTIKTRMTNPEFNFGYIKTAFEDQLREGIAKYRAFSVDIRKVPERVAKGTVKGASDLSEALVSGTFGLAKVFKNTFAYAFKKEK